MNPEKLEVLMLTQNEICTNSFPFIKNHFKEGLLVMKYLHTYSERYKTGWRG